MWHDKKHKIVIAYFKRIPFSVISSLWLFRNTRTILQLRAAVQEHHGKKMSARNPLEIGCWLASPVMPDIISTPKLGCEISMLGDFLAVPVSTMEFSWVARVLPDALTLHLGFQVNVTSCITTCHFLPGPFLLPFRRLKVGLKAQPSEGLFL